MVETKICAPCTFYQREAFLGPCSADYCKTEMLCQLRSSNPHL